MTADFGIAGMMEKEYFSKAIPREKIILGIPLYGRKFSVPNPYVPSGQSTPVEYRNLPFGECQRQFDTESLVPFLSCNGYYVSYDDEESIRAKMDYAKTNGLGGVYFWALGQDDNLLLEKLKLSDP
jgi:chitinase